ncbi:MAG: HEAT repeat domain-containing protein [Nannocystaceae bacterium]|nr:HEAT repeat domain-containing protein [Nannocystaceae bacterium]
MVRRAGKAETGQGGWNSLTPSSYREPAMGVWERFGNLLSSGASVELELGGQIVPAGGVLSGTVRLRGGRKGLQIVGVHVSVVRTAVRPPGSSTTSEIQQRAIVDTTIRSGLQLAPRGKRDLEFSLRLPRDTESSNDDTSYRVRAEAELESGRSPTAYRPIRVVDASAGRPTLPTILTRFSGLSSKEDATVLEALSELRWAHDALDPERDLLASESTLSKLVADRGDHVRTAALEAWSSVVAGRAGEDHVQWLLSLAKDAHADAAWLVCIAEAAGRMTSARALPVLELLSTHSSAVVRKTVAQGIGRIDKRRSKLTMLETMRRDADEGVRAAVYRAMGEFADELAVVEMMAAHTTMEPRAAVLEACISSLGGAMAHGHAEVVRPALERLARHPKASVRVALARAMYFVEQDEGSLPIARMLLDDSDDEVRYAAAVEVRNLPMRGRMLCGRLETMAVEDPSPRARRGALTSMPEFTAIDRVVAHFEDLIETETDPEILRGLIDGIKFRREPQYRELLETLARHHDADIAADAEAALQTPLSQRSARASS